MKGAVAMLFSIVVASQLALASNKNELVAVGPLPAPDSAECTTPDAGSLVAGHNLVAYLQICSQIEPGYPTTLNVVRYDNGSAKRSTYQLRTLRPKLVSVDEDWVTWLQVGPNPYSSQGNHPVLMEMNLRTLDVKSKRDKPLPFSSGLMKLSRGKLCTMVRVARNKEAYLISIADSKAGLRSIPISSDEQILFWDEVGAGFVVAQYSSTGKVRAINCSGGDVAISKAAQEILKQPRDVLDDFYSAPHSKWIARDPIKKGEQATVTLVAANERSEDQNKQVEVSEIHGMATTSTGDRIAVVGSKTIEVIGPGDLRQSYKIDKALGWDTQAVFLKGRSALVVLSNSNTSIIDMEH